MQKTDDIQVPDFIPSDWEKPKDEESDDDTQEWRIQFKYRFSKYDVGLYTYKQAKEIWYLWATKRGGIFEVRDLHVVHMIPFSRIRKMKIVK